MIIFYKVEDEEWEDGIYFNEDRGFFLVRMGRYIDITSMAFIHSTDVSKYFECLLSAIHCPRY